MRHNKVPVSYLLFGILLHIINFISLQINLLHLYPMKRNILNLTLTIMAILLATPIQAATNPKREHRSAWVTTCWRMDWPTSYGTGTSVATKQKAEADAILDLMKESGFNAVYFQVRGMSDAMYKSSYEPWSSYLTGTRGAAPSYDPLEYWVAACHERGMECYAWINPYRYESSVSGASWTGSTDYRKTHPDWILEYNNASILNPGIEAVKTRIVDVCREIVTNYDIDGIVFDDYFYLNSVPNSYDSSLYNSSGTTLSQGDWRRENVNDMVRKVNAMIKSVKPYVKFGISPAGVSKTSASKYGISTSSISSAPDWQYEQICSDPLAWLGEGSIDFISPQIYWLTSHSTNGYGKISKWWSDACANVFDRHFYSSHSISFLYGANTTSNYAEIATQIQYNRDYSSDNAPGCVLFASRDFTGIRTEGLAPYLKSNSFQNLALQPTMTFKSEYASDPGTVTNLTLSGSTLSWNGYNNMRYAVYAVPNGITPGDDVSSEYLIGNPYSSSFDVRGYTSGYQLGVSVVDRYSYEYKVTWLGSSVIIETLPQTTIETPSDGSTVNTGFNFSWSENAVSGVTYTIEVSTSSTFATIPFSATTTATSYYSGNFAFVEGTTYYWRVKASKEGYAGSTSWVGSFTIASSSSGGGSEDSDLTKDPASYNSVNGMTIESKWIYSVNTSNFPSSLTVANRSMTTLNGKVYVSQQGGTLLEFSGETGELLRTISLTGDCKTSSSGTSLSYATNDVFVDDAGHLCVSNLTINTSSQPLTVCTVDLTTGSTTRVFESSISTSLRIDYVAATGDITTTGGKIWAAVANASTVYQWKRNSKGSWTAYGTTIGSYFSNTSNAANTNSTAPRIMPVSDTKFILDGHNSAPSLYTFVTSGTATLDDSFASNLPLAPSADNWNGVCTAKLGNTPIFVYVSSIAPCSFSVVTNPSNFAYSAMQNLWTLPANGLGSAINGSVSSQPAAINNADGSVTLFLYSPCNGLACYLLKPSTTTPTLETVSLTSPIGGSTVNSGFDFMWSTIPGATYTLEVSTSSTFSSVAFSSTTTSSSYSSSNFNLATGTTYYWRVKAAKSGYIGTTSSIASFKTATPALDAVTLEYPTNGTTVSADGFEFKWSAISGATYTIDISTLATFATTMFSVETRNNSIASSNFNFAENTKYYWRVKATKSGSTTSTSSIESFMTPQVSVPEEPEPPTTGVPTDGVDYAEIENLRIKNLWIYSLTKGNFPEELGRDQRGMAAHNGNIYISERSNGAGYLLEFNGETGEYQRTIALTGDYKTLYEGNSLGYLCNDVFVDNAGHLCVSNMVLSFSSSSQLTICIVDINTGATTRVFETYINSASMRFDYCSVYGDITKTGAKVFAAASSHSGSSSYRNRVYCWTRSADHIADTDQYYDWKTYSYSSASSYYPQNASNFGSGPRVLPIDDTRLVIDGNAIYPTLYNFGTSLTIEDGFSSNLEICPTGYANAGMCTGTINGKQLFIYSFNDNETEFFNFAIVHNPSDFNFEDMKMLWKVPQDGLGNVGNTYISAIPATINNANGTLTLFIYVPNNGIAAYLISDATSVGVEDVEVAKTLTIKLVDRTIKTNKTAELIKVYSTAGALVATASNCNEINLSALPDGIYIIEAQDANSSISESIILK